MDRTIGSTVSLVCSLQKENTDFTLVPDRKHKGYGFVILRDKDKNNDEGSSISCSLPDGVAEHFQRAFNQCEYVKVWFSVHTRNAVSNKDMLPKNYLDFYFCSHLGTFVPTSADDAIQVAAHRRSGSDADAFTFAVIGVLLPDDDVVDERN